jgi:hypothetical protein
MSAADIIARGQELATKGKVATFDLVFEYNHAVEAWQVSNGPVQVVALAVMQVLAIGIEALRLLQ